MESIVSDLRVSLFYAGVELDSTFFHEKAALHAKKMKGNPLTRNSTSISVAHTD